VSDKLKLAFAETLADARTKAGLSKQALADHSNMSVTYVKKLESGQAVPSLITMWKLSGPLKISLATFGHHIEVHLSRTKDINVKLSSAFS
jgi:transcriptional regulator with XRE-family HTH domain